MHAVPHIWAAHSLVADSLPLTLPCEFYSPFAISLLLLLSYLVRVKVSADAGNNNSAAAAAAPATPTFSYRIGSRGAAEISTTSLYRGMCETIFGTAPNPAHLNQIKRNEELSRSRAGKPNAKPAAAPPAASQA